MQERARGLHKVNTFNLKTHITAQWAAGQPAAAVHRQGLAHAVRRPHPDGGGGRCAGHSHGAGVAGRAGPALKPGTFHPTYSRGLHAVLPEGVRGQAEALTATLDLELVGTERLSIVPLGGNTEVKMTAAGPTPRSTGVFCPPSAPGGPTASRPSGACHRWPPRRSRTLPGRPPCVRRQLRRAATDALRPRRHQPRDCADSFSVAFIDPVNPYTLSDRATKYGLLFIALTFVAVGLFELMGNGPHAPPLRGSLPPEGAAFSSWGGPATKRLRVHPVQYLLVGSALCSFFLLLVSLSEHLPFGWSYGIAATACVLLLGYYASHMLGSLARGCRWARALHCCMACCTCCCNWSKPRWPWARWRCSWC
jgi:inner membrane protein